MHKVNLTFELDDQDKSELSWHLLAGRSSLLSVYIPLLGDFPHYKKARALKDVRTDDCINAPSYRRDNEDNAEIKV